MPAIPPRRNSNDQQPLPPTSDAEEAIIGNINNNDNTNNNNNNNQQDNPSTNNTREETEQENEGTSKSKTQHPSPPPQTIPKPTLRFQIHDLSHEGVQSFLSAINVSHVLQEALDTVCHILYNAPTTISTSVSTDTNTSITPATTTTNTTTTSPSPPPPTTAPLPYPRPNPPIPQIRSITLILNPMSGVAYTTGIPLDSMHKEIHLSLSYITHVSSQQPSFNPADATAKLTHELTGVIVHETVHTLQNDGSGTAPSGLIEGLADFVRLRAGLAAPHWIRPQRREDVEGAYEWDAGYEKTAFFLEWVEGREGCAGTVVRMNEWLREGRYEGGEEGDGGFWREICGEGVSGLWRGYLEWVEEEGEMAEAVRLSLLGVEEEEGG